jgi:hypothetical protein
VKSRWSIYDGKILIEDIIGMPPHEQRIIFAGKELNDERYATGCRVVVVVVAALIMYNSSFAHYGI